MDKLRVYYDREGNTLSVWFDDPNKEHVCEESDDDLILVKAHGANIDAIGGMGPGFSGSPVYINNELVGSVSYGLGGDVHDPADANLTYAIISASCSLPLLEAAGGCFQLSLEPLDAMSPTASSFFSATFHTRTVLS